MRNKWFLILGMLLLSLGLVWGQTYLINENIQNWTAQGSYGSYTQTIPAGTVNMTQCIVQPAAAASGTGTAGRVQMEATYGILEFPGLSSVGTATFTLAAGAAYRTVKLQSYNGSSWTDLTTFSSIGTTGATYSYDINSGSSTKLRLASPSQALYVHDIKISSFGGITVTPSTLTGFTYTVGSGPSTEKTFTVSGSNLTANISLSAPTNYEISTSSGSGYGSSLGLTQSGGSVASTTIYVRLKAGLAVGNYNGETITASSTGATDKTVTCNGSVTKPAVPAAPVATAATAVSKTSFTANWNAVAGATGYYLDVYKKTGAYTTDLIISEYVEGNSNNKYIEIFNGTGASVELNGYKLELYANGASTATNSVTLSGSLAHGAVKVYKNSGAALTLPSGVTAYDNAACNFNGNDAVALWRISTSKHVDIFGVIGQNPTSPSASDQGKGAWTAAGGYSTEDKTLVRKASICSGIKVSPTGYTNGNPAAFETLATEWDMHNVDTATYLGSHTFNAFTNSYISGLQNKNVNNVITYTVTGLDPNTKYYYVVRAYDGYEQTSASSNEKEVTTNQYDLPQGQNVAIGTSTFNMGAGNANIVDGGVMPTYPNTGFTPSLSVVLDLIGSGPWSVQITTSAPWGAYHRGGSWTTAQNSGGKITFNDITAAKDMQLPIILGDQNPTLPVELSAFNVSLNSRNKAVLSWVSETETGMIGYYIYRNTENDLETALQISELIPATNTSQQQVYIFTDKELAGAGKYYYWLQTSDMDGTMGFHGPIYLIVEYEQNGSQAAPLLTRLGSIYPNPFNPDTTISYSLATSQEIELKIYNTRGQKVRTLEKGSRNPGNYRLVWNGTDDNGKTLSSGIYFIRLDAGKKSFVNKAILLK